MKHITVNNLSEAVASAAEHERFAVFAGVCGDSREARRHSYHARAIMREVKRLTQPSEDIMALTDDELLKELQ